LAENFVNVQYAEGKILLVSDHDGEYSRRLTLLLTLKDDAEKTHQEVFPA
jgi:hypothetical protein